MSFTDTQQKTPESSLGTVFFLNVSGEIIPPYAAMIIEQYEFDEERGRSFAKCRKCTEEDEKAQNPRQILFNRHSPIIDDERVIGRGTWTVPTGVLMAGPELTAPSEGGNAKATERPDEPQPWDVVGPARDSWELWRGGATHTILDIDIVGTQRLATVMLHTGGAWVRVSNDIDASTGDAIATGIVRLQARELGAFVDAKAVDGNLMELEVEHGGPAISATSRVGQAKICHGKWALDVHYC